MLKTLSDFPKAETNNWYKGFELVSSDYQKFLEDHNMVLQEAELLSDEEMDERYEFPEKAFKDDDWEQVFLHPWKGSWHYLRKDWTPSHFFPLPYNRWLQGVSFKDVGEFFKIYIEELNHSVFVKKTTWEVFEESSEWATKVQKAVRKIKDISEEIWSL